MELVAEGPRAGLEELIKDCQHGPDVAWVKHADVRWEKGTGEFMGFEVIY